MRPYLHWKNMENLIFPRKGGGILGKVKSKSRKNRKNFLCGGKVGGKQVV